MKTCSIDGCESAVRSRGWCIAHYERWRRNGDPNKAQRDWRPAAHKVRDLSVPDSETGCVLWTGYVTKSGYGQVADRGSLTYAHRAVWEEANGPIPAGLEIDHLCFVRNCVSLAHLDLVTPEENKRRMLERVVAGRTHCPHGHPYDGPNLLVDPHSGQRRCRTCRDAQMASRNERRRAS